LFLIGVRPWALRWGASDEEAHARLPGDELIDAATQSTRAITIDAPAERVWPWLLQLGQDRGGFYSYTLLENLVGTDMKNLDVLRPELQAWQVGDKLWMYPPDKLGGQGYAVLARLDPARALVFSTRRIGSERFDGSWAFVLRPIDAQATRLLIRGRSTPPRSKLQRGFELLAFEPIHFMMEHKMMENLKAHAEGREPSAVTDALELVMYASCFFLFCAAAIRLVRWPVARRWLLVIVSAGLGFQLLTFVQPPWIIGLVLVGALTVLFEFAEQL
jgi:hypothetical protein